MRKLALLLGLAGVFLMAACGGGNGSGPTSSTITSVSVSCSPTTVTSGQTSQCSATVSGTGNFSMAVVWSSSAGTISSSGLLTTPTVSSTTQITVTATSVQDVTKSGTATVTVNPSMATNNVQPIVVDAGPAGASGVVNVAYVTVTVCVPGSTSQCQTIDHVQLDTGSSGLRLLSSVLTIPLPQENDSLGNPLDECLVFLDGYIWGPVELADVTIAGEQASSVPVHVIIPSSSSPPVPRSCSGQTTGSNEGGSVGGPSAPTDSLASVSSSRTAANFVSPIPATPFFYYDCPASGCNPTTATLAQQVPNPVTMFPADNNGVLIQLPSVVDGGTASVSGSLIFGIGTQSNNGLGNATIYNVPDGGSNAGDHYDRLQRYEFSQKLYRQRFERVFSFLMPASQRVQGPTRIGIVPPPRPTICGAQNQGQRTSGRLEPVTVNFSLEDADICSTTTTGKHRVQHSGRRRARRTWQSFDWGLSFFYGKNMFTAIENMSTPGGTGPYFAY